MHPQRPHGLHAGGVGNGFYGMRVERCMLYVIVYWSSLIVGWVFLIASWLHDGEVGKLLAIIAVMLFSFNLGWLLSPNDRRWGDEDA